MDSGLSPEKALSGWLNNLKPGFAVSSRSTRVEGGDLLSAGETRGFERETWSLKSVSVFKTQSQALAWLDLTHKPYGMRATDVLSKSRTTKNRAKSRLLTRFSYLFRDYRWGN